MTMSQSSPVHFHCIYLFIYLVSLFVCFEESPKLDTEKAHRQYVCDICQVVGIFWRNI